MAAEDFNVFDHMKWFDEEPSSQIDTNFAQQMEALEQKIGTLEREAAALGEQVAKLAKAVQSLENSQASDESRRHRWRRRFYNVCDSLRNVRWFGFYIGT